MRLPSTSVVARFYINNEAGAYRILMKDSDNVESLAVEDYVIGFRKGDDALKSKVEETLKAMAKDGKLAEIAKEWFGEDVTTISKDYFLRPLAVYKTTCTALFILAMKCKEECNAVNFTSAAGEYAGGQWGDAGNLFPDAAVLLPPGLLLALAG